VVDLIGGERPQGGCSGGGVFSGPKLVGIYFASRAGFASELMLSVTWLRAWGQQQMPVIEFVSLASYSLPGGIQETPLNDQSPYQGLHYFDENDADRFFGRDAVRQSILNTLKIDRLLILYGPSGSGKSSLLRAGVVNSWAKEHAGSRRVIFLPNDNPFYSFASQLGEPFTHVPTANWLVNILKSQGKSTSWLLAMDQGEQLFTRTPETGKVGEESYRPRSVFLDALAQAATDAIDCRIVIALRDEFFNDIRASEKFQHLTAEHFIRIPELTETDLEEIVRRPAEGHGVAVEPRLVKAIVGDMADQPGALPLLQVALGEVWRS
jgi:hypothetical protein